MPNNTPSSNTNIPSPSWPSLDYAAWQPTYATLHRWTQIAGKVKLELCPFLNELWEVALYPTADGLSTGPIPSPTGVFEIRFDFIHHNLRILTSEGGVKALPLQPRSIADFYAEFMAALRSLGIEVRITPVPDEVADRTPFDEDYLHTSYDAGQVQRWWRVLLQVSKLLEAHRSSFTGKSSPVNFFWGAFDLAQTRFSGRTATKPKDAPLFMRLSEDQENVSTGFWPGSEQFPEAVFYSYTYPEPPGLKTATIGPGPAYYDTTLGEFVLRYEDVRTAESPETMIREFLQRTYEVGATLGRWDRQALERPIPVVSKLARARRRAAGGAAKR